MQQNSIKIVVVGDGAVGKVILFFFLFLNLKNK